MSETPQMPITFFHSSPIHIDTFDALRDKLAPGYPISHVVRENFLQAAQKAGEVTEAIRFRVEEEMLKLVRSDVRVVVCTCSTLGEVVESFSAPSMMTMRIDRPMADEAVASGGPVELCASLAPAAQVTRALLESSAAAQGRHLDIRTHVFEECWDAFQQGDMDLYHGRIATRLKALRAREGVIVLAQASMQPAVALAGELAVPVLSSVETGFIAALACAQQQAA